MERLRKWLDESGTSQAELARKMNVAAPTVWQWLEGLYLPSAERLMGLSEVTGLSLEELLADSKRNGGKRGRQPRPNA